MGKAIFQTEIIELGEQVDAFFEEGMFVLFGENVPDTLKDFCHFIDQKKVDGTIKKDEEIMLRLRGLYHGYGYKPFKMSRFEEYDL